MVRPSQRRIGVTGGIACGKSTVAQYLATQYDLPILDADRYAKAALEGEILDRVVSHFGNSILREGQLDRRALGRIVFAQSEERRWLEAQIHPFVRQKLLSETEAYFPQTVVLEIPLLFEAAMTDLVSEIWVVACSEATMCQRLQERNQLSAEEAKARIAAQISIEEKCSRADLVLQNTGSLQELYQQIDRVMQS